ncbi:WYL domain-containing protein [Jutongia huaianensis]
MRNIRMMEQKREGENVFRQVDVSKYTNMHFGMFSGQEQTVELLCQNQSIGIIMDRFGTETRLCKVDEEHFRATINVVVSNNFLGWLIGLGDDIKIVGPENVLQMMQERVQSLMEMYGKEPS